MGGQIAIASQLCVNGRDVESAGAFVLEFAVFDHRAFAADNFSDRIGEVSSVAEADVTFEHSHLCRFFGNDQIARTRCGASFFAGRDEKQMNWRFDNFAPRDMDECAVLEESGVK